MRLRDGQGRLGSVIHDETNPWIASQIRKATLVAFDDSPALRTQNRAR